MNDIQIKLQNELFNEHYKLFRILVYGCGGVMFRQHFIKFMGGSESKCNEIIKLMEDFKLVKQLFKRGRELLGYKREKISVFLVL